MDSVKRCHVCNSNPLQELASKEGQVESVLTFCRFPSSSLIRSAAASVSSRACFLGREKPDRAVVEAAASARILRVRKTMVWGARAVSSFFFSEQGNEIFQILLTRPINSENTSTASLFSIKCLRKATKIGVFK